MTFKNRLHVWTLHTVCAFIHRLFSCMLELCIKKQHQISKEIKKARTMGK